MTQDNYIWSKNIKLTDETPPEVIYDIVMPERVNDLFYEYQHGFLCVRGGQIDLSTILISFIYMSSERFSHWLRRSIGRKAARMIVPSSVINYRLRDIFYLALSCPNVAISSDDGFLAIYLALAIPRTKYEPSNAIQILNDWETFKTESYEKMIDRGVSKTIAKDILLDYYKTKFLYYQFDTINIVKRSYNINREFIVSSYEVYITSQLLDRRWD